MEEFQAYAPEEIILSNLEELLERSLKTAEQELAHLRELAAEIAADVSDEGDFPAALPDHRIPSMEAEIALPHHLQAYAAPLYRAAATRRRALLCTELIRLVGIAVSLVGDPIFGVFGCFLLCREKEFLPFALQGRNQAPQLGAEQRSAAGGRSSVQRGGVGLQMMGPGTFRLH